MFSKEIKDKVYQKEIPTITKRLDREISWEDKFKLDVWYVDNWSLRLDIKIILKTVAKVIKREGISEKGQETMSEFMGSDAN